MPWPSWSGVVGGDTPEAVAVEGRVEARLGAVRDPVADDSMWGTDAAPLKNCAGAKGARDTSTSTNTYNDFRSDGGAGQGLVRGGGTG